MRKTRNHKHCFQFRLTFQTALATVEYFKSHYSATTFINWKNSRTSPRQKLSFQAFSTMLSMKIITRGFPKCFARLGHSLTIIFDLKSTKSHGLVPKSTVSLGRSKSIDLPVSSIAESRLTCSFHYRCCGQVFYCVLIKTYATQVKFQTLGLLNSIDTTYFLVILESGQWLFDASKNTFFGESYCNSH